MSKDCTECRTTLKVTSAYALKVLGKRHRRYIAVGGAIVEASGEIKVYLDTLPIGGFNGFLHLLPCEFWYPIFTLPHQVFIFVPNPIIFFRVVSNGFFFKNGNSFKFWPLQQNNSPKGFIFLIKRGNALIPYTKYICAHMEVAKNGFDMAGPAIVYYVRFDREGETPIYKIGITNTTTKRRLKSLRIKPGIKHTVLKEIRFKEGMHAAEAEKSFHNEFLEYRYIGPPIARNGNTELFSRDVLGYDT